MFRERNDNTEFATLTVTCVCVCGKPDCLHILDIAVFCIATNTFATNHYSMRNKLSHSSRHFIHSRFCLRFLARSCVLCLYWSLSWVTWRAFQSDTRPRIIQSFRFHKENIISGFAICHPGQRRVPLLVVHKLQYFLEVFNPLSSQNSHEKRKKYS
jgi:hypothetical protein